MGIRYCGTFYHGNRLSSAAKVYLEHLPSGVKGLLSQGTSGCAIASAMLTKSRRDLNHVAVRKDGESSHQQGYAGNTEIVKYAIVDDFIDTGKTVKNVWDWAKARGLDVVVVLVGRITNAKIKRAIKCPMVVLDNFIKD